MNKRNEPQDATFPTNGEVSLSSDTFEQLLDDTAPTLLDFLDSFEDDATSDTEIDALPDRRPTIYNGSE